MCRQEPRENRANRNETEVEQGRERKEGKDTSKDMRIMKIKPKI